MKNIYKKVLTLAMGLLLTVGASAQVNHFVKNDAAKRAAIENMDMSTGKYKLSDAKAAGVTTTVSNITATTADFAFDMNEETYVYFVVFDFDGFIPMLMQYGYDELSAAVALVNQGMYEAVAFSDTTLTAVSGFLPGSPNTVYVVAADAEMNAAVTTAQFTMLTQGSTGVPVVALNVTDITTSTMNVTTTMDTNTNIYYFAMTEARYYAGVPDDTVIRDLVASGLAYGSNLSYMEEGLLPGTTYTYFVYPLNANDQPGALIRQDFTTQAQGGTGTAEVTVTVSNITTTSFDVATTMNDQTNLYYFAYADPTVFAGASLAEIEASIVEQMNPYIENVSGTINELLPGSTQILFCFPYNANGELGTPAIDTVVLQSQGGTGTAEVTLTLTNNPDATVGFTTTMNDQTNYYYFAFAESAGFAGATDDQIIEAVVSQRSPYTENLNSTITSFQANVSYDFFIVPFNANHEMGTFYKTSLVAGQVFISDVNGISYSIYPNPATSVVNVEGENIDRVELYNALGQRVMSQNVNGTAAQFDVNNLTKGAYILKVYSNGQESVQKVVVK